MLKYQSWLWFHKPERNYHLLSYRLTGTAENMNRLNDRRREIHRALAELTSGVSVCITCGACCKGDYDHFTAVDFHVRAFSEKPLTTYGAIWRPKPIHRIILDSVRPASNETAGASGEHSRCCPRLGPQGCDLAPEDRPIRCVLWTCRVFRDALSAEKQRKVGQLTRELDQISRKVVRVLNGRG